MGYNSDTKLVTKPIDITDIAAALGVASRDVGTLCSSDRINMWAKHKPIKFAKWSELTERDIISAHDPANNIFFGIKITGTINGVFDHTLSELHSATFTYIRPEGGALEPFRMTDFNNYKHDAKPNPNASFHIKDRDGEQLVGYCNDKDDQYGSLAGIEVGYDGTNIYGVDFTAMYSDGDGERGETLENNLKRSYPCILVTDESTGKSYFTALDYPAVLGQKSVARPLFYNGSGVSSQNWSVRFEKPTYSNGVNTGVSDKAPWQSFKDGLKATLFLVKSWDINGPFLDAAKKQNFYENWMELSAAGSVYQGAARPIVLPADKLGAPLTIRRKGASSVYFTPVAAVYESGIIKITYEKVGSTTETFKLESSARLDGITATKTAVDVSPQINPMITFTASDFGMQLFMPNMKYTIKVTLTTTDSSGSTAQTGTFEFTA
jgi:hypothetical protein